MNLEKDFEKKLSDVTNYSDLLEVASWHVTKNNYTAMVCGPIFSSGPDKTAENLVSLELAIKKLESEGVKIFNQIPFLDINLAQETKIQHFETEKKFQEFYSPLLGAGSIKTVYMMPGWENSIGSQWEHDAAIKNNLEIIYL